jgi:integral membrane sensor domain MASE1
MPSETVDAASIPPESRPGSWGPVIVGVPLLAAAYFIGGRLGLSLAVLNPSATTVWPPTGIALAACLVYGLRLWPGVLAGALMVNLATSGSWPASFGIAIGNTLEAVLGCVLVQRFAEGRRAFESPGNVFRFTVCAPVLSTTVSATCGVLSLIGAGQAPWSQAGSIWTTWWLGDMGGALIVAPLLILWAKWEPVPLDLRRLAEGAALAAFLIVLEVVIFHSHSFAVGFLAIPGVLWAAFRFQPRGTSAVVFLLSVAALWGSLRLSWRIPAASRQEAMVLLQAFLAVLSITALAVCAAVRDRRRNSENLARQLVEVARLNQQLDSRNEEIHTYHILLTHDITNIAMALLGLVERLLLQADGPLTPKQEQLLRRSNRQALEMNRMGQNARMLAAIREQGLPAPTDPQEIREALDRAVRVVHDLHFERSFEVRVDCPTGMTVQTLPMLDSILVNLLDNGVRHTPRDQTPDLEVRVKPVDHRLMIEIEGGAPPPPDVLAQLFDPELQRKRSTGHGIGLRLVREVLHRAGGTITAQTVKKDSKEVFEVAISVPTG